MKAFITGITGMAGSYLAEHLIARGDEVMGCSRRGVWPLYLPETLPRRAELLAWDVSTPLAEANRQRIARFAPDWIFHLAGLSVPGDCGWPEPTPLALATNVGGTEAVCQLASSLASKPRLVLASSCLVYGDVQPDAPPVKESHPTNPTGGYGKTKLAAEEVVERFAREGRIEGMVARGFHHTGPRHLPRMMTPQWCRQLVSTGDDEPLRIFTRDASMDLSDVRDVVRAYRLLAERGRSGVTYNVGGGRSVRSGEVLEILLRLCGSQREVIETKPGVRANPIADIQRLQAETGWAAEIPLEKMLQDTLKFWRSRPFE